MTTSTQGSDFNKLSKLALGLALGITWGLSVLLLGWLGGAYEWAKPMVDAISIFYIGYEPGFVGGIIGGVLGFIDGFIGGVIIAFFYNLSLCCRRGCKRSNKE